jgi:hypothetical protein
MLADRYGLSLSTSSQPRRPEPWSEVRDFADKSFPKARVAFADVHRAVACAATGDSAGLEQLVLELREHLAAGNLPAGQVVARRATVNVARFSAEPTLQ